MISEDRLNHLAFLVTDGVWKDDMVDYKDDDHAVRAAKQAMLKFRKEGDDIDKAARNTVMSLKRNVIEGTPEWDILYSKYYEQEMSRRGNN